MYSQFAPGLNENFARQEYKRLLEEAAKSRLAHKLSTSAHKSEVHRYNHPPFVFDLNPRLGYFVGFTLLAVVTVIRAVVA